MGLITQDEFASQSIDLIANKATKEDIHRMLNSISFKSLYTLTESTVL